MPNNHDTTKVNIQIAEAEKALQELRSNLDLDQHGKRAHLDTIELAIKIFEHKMLRIKELETEIMRLKSIRYNESHLMHEMIQLQQDLDEALEKISLYESKLTGTGF